MPILHAAKKALRASARKRIVNDAWRKKVHEALYAVRDAIRENKQKEAQEAFIQASSVLDRAARRNIIHPNKAARKKARLSKALTKIQ